MSYNSIRTGDRIRVKTTDIIDDINNIKIGDEFIVQWTQQNLVYIRKEGFYSFLTLYDHQVKVIERWKK